MMARVRTFGLKALAGGVLTLALVAADPLGAGPSDARAQSLEEALATAYLNNPQLQSRRAGLRATDQGVPAAQAGWRPTVSVNGSVGYNRVSRNIQDAPKRTVTQTTPGQIGISITQPLFRGFRTDAQVTRAEETVFQERANLLSTEQQVLLDAATAYLNVLRDLSVVELNRNNEDVLARQLDATRDRFRVGEITRTDVAQAEARLSGATADTAGSLADLESSRANFTRLVGTVPNGLTAPAVLPSMPGSLDDTVAAALANNPSVLAAEHAWRAAQEEIRNQRGRLLPTVDLEGSYTHGWETGGIDKSESNTLSGQISLTVPIYQGGEVYAGLREAKHTAGQRRLDLEDARTQAREQAQQAWERMQATRSRIAALEDQIDAAEIALEGVQREAQVGARTVLDVLDAEQELLNARVDLVRAERDEVAAAFNVLAAIGGMTASALQLPVQLYDPTQNYKSVEGQWFGSTAAAESDAALGRTE